MKINQNGDVCYEINTFGLTELTITMPSGLARFWQRMLKWWVISMVVTVFRRTWRWQIAVVTVATAITVAITAITVAITAAAAVVTITIRHSRSIKTGMSIRGTAGTPRGIRPFIFSFTITISITSISFSVTFVFLVFFPVNPLTRFFPLWDFWFAIVVVLLSWWTDMLRPISNSLRFLFCSCASFMADASFNFPLSFSFTRWAVVSFSLLLPDSLSIWSFMHVTSFSRTITKGIRTIGSKPSSIWRITSSLTVAVITTFGATVFWVSLSIKNLQLDFWRSTSSMSSSYNAD